MTVRDLFSRIADDQEASGLVDRTAQTGAAIAGTVYGVGAAAKRLLFQTGLRGKKRLRITTLSVGNITMGGTGKTPFTIWLARFVKKEGRNPVILSRGYGRKDEESLQVVHNGRKLRSDVENGGDEPVLMATILGNIPIVADAWRYRGGKYAEKRLNIDVALLDDGMQHVELDRQGEFVLLDSTKPLERLQVVPRGTLREPLSALKKAHLFVVTRCDQATNLKLFLRKLKKRCPSTPVACTKFSLTGFERVSDKEAVTTDYLKDKKAYLVTAVGNPDSVKRVLDDNNITVAAQRIYPDHATFSRRDLREWKRAAKNAGASSIVVTQKDAVKLMNFPKLPRQLLAMKTELEFMSKRDQSIAENTVRSRLRLSPIAGSLSAAK